MEPMTAEETEALQEFEAKALPVLRNIVAAFRAQSRVDLSESINFQMLEDLLKLNENDLTQVACNDPSTFKYLSNVLPCEWKHPDTQFKAPGGKLPPLSKQILEWLTSTENPAIGEAICNIIKEKGSDYKKLPADDRQFIEAAALLKQFAEEWLETEKYKPVFKAAIHLMKCKSHERQREAKEQREASEDSILSLLQQAQKVSEAEHVTPEEAKWIEQIKNVAPLKDRFRRPKDIESPSSEEEPPTPTRQP